MDKVKSNKNATIWQVVWTYTSEFIANWVTAIVLLYLCGVIYRQLDAEFGLNWMQKIFTNKDIIRFLKSIGFLIRKKQS